MVLMESLLKDRPISHCLFQRLLNVIQFRPHICSSRLTCLTTLLWSAWSDANSIISTAASNVLNGKLNLFLF